jgi:hypothetical protein
VQGGLAKEGTARGRICLGAVSAARVHVRELPGVLHWSAIVAEDQVAVCGDSQDQLAAGRFNDYGLRFHSRNLNCLMREFLGFACLCGHYGHQQRGGKDGYMFH